MLRSWSPPPPYLMLAPKTLKRLNYPYLFLAPKTSKDMSYVLSPAWNPGQLRRNLHSGDKTQSASRLQSEFGLHVPRCPLLCSLLIPPQPLPISPHCVLITWLFSLINWDLDRNPPWSPLFFPAHFSCRFAVPLVPMKNWVLLDGTKGDREWKRGTWSSIGWGDQTETLSGSRMNRKKPATTGGRWWGGGL